MNRLHRWYCRSAHWQRAVARDLLDWTLDEAPLGDHLLELGAGHGTVTAHLRRKVSRLTAIDVDDASLIELRRRCCLEADGGLDAAAVDSPVQPVCADAMALPFAAGTFSSVAAFVMLHHVGGAERQWLLLREARRVLRPGGVFVGSDAVWSVGLRLLHVGDVFAPVPPARLAPALRAAGFGDVNVCTAGRRLRWRAQRIE